MSRTVLFTIDKYEELLETLLELKQGKKDIYLTVKNESIEEEKNNNTNISLIALEKLEELGFKKDIGTILFAGLIEDLYHERRVFDSSDYFDLSKPNNPHYKYLVNRTKVGNEDNFKALIARSIGTSSCETKNINEIAYKVTNEICKKLDKRLILKKEA